MMFSAQTQCLGKRRYAKRRDARKAARQAETQQRTGHLIPYPCPHCGWFHVGHPVTHV